MDSKYLERLPKELLRIIELASDVSLQLGYHAYLVGGFVRDLILKRENFDLDITVEGNGIEFAKRLAERLQGESVYHLRFGTATVVSPEGFKIDIATCRRESYPKPAMLPCVEESDIRADLMRRDFTINSLAIRIYPDNKQDLIDFFGGYSDLLKKKIRILHDRSFIDDPTRILRAIRFEQRFGFCIERHTLSLLKEAVSLDMLAKVSPSRLKDELVLLLKEEDPLRCIRRIDELLDWDWLIRGLRLDTEKVYFLNSIKRIIKWYNNNFSYKRRLDNWLIYLIGLLDGLNKTKVDSFLKKFSFSKGQRKRVLSYIIKNKTLRLKLKRRLKPSIIYRYLEPLSYEVILLIMAKSANRFLRKNIEDFFRIYNNVKLNITGKDLKDLGLTEGPDYKLILEKLLYAKLDYGIKTRQEELYLIKTLIKK